MKNTLRLACALIAFVFFIHVMIFSINSAFSYKSRSLTLVNFGPENELLRSVFAGSLRHAHKLYRDYKDTRSKSFASYSSLSEHETACSYFSKIHCDSDINLYEELEITVNKKQNPLDISNIFYVIGESYSDWIFDDIFDEIHLSSGVKSLIKEYGIKIQNNLEVSHNTIGSLNNQITGLFDTEFLLSDKRGVAKCPKTAPAFVLKELGFKSIFHYGGNAEWNNLSWLAKACAFSEVIDGDVYLRDLKGKSELKYSQTSELKNNTWGVHDDIAFDYIKEHAKDMEAHFIMTITNHSPYNYPFAIAKLKDIDINNPFDAQGSVLVPKEEIKEFLNKIFPEMKDKYLNEFCTIFWYDKVLAKFIKDILEKHPKALIAITADHYGRFFPDEKTTLQNTKTVPFILITKAAKLRPILNNTNHLDIASSIINLIASNNFKYPSFGQIAVEIDDEKSDLSLDAKSDLSSKAKYQENNISSGYFIVSNGSWYYSPDEGIFYTLERGLNYEKSEISDEQKERDLKTAKDAWAKQQMARALSWYLQNKGFMIYKSPESPN